MNPQIFASYTTSIKNDAGGRAYELSPEAALALYAMTGTFNDTYYADAAMHLERVLELCTKCSPAFIAKLAVYARQKGHMKDMPSFLLAVLASKDVGLLAKAWPHVVDNGKMLRNFVQVVRSGATGRKSLGTRPRALIRQWFADRTPEAVFRQSTGANPSMADVLKLSHPKPRDKEEDALFGWLLDKKFDPEALPSLVQAYERYKLDGLEMPNVPFEMLTSLPLTDDNWKKTALNATWSQLRQNLNSFQRHHVFDDARVVDILCAKLRDPGAIHRAKAFPYQLLTTYQNTPNISLHLQLALEDALEVATQNVPKLEGDVFLCVDVSGSMWSPVTGNREGSPSTVTRCVAVAALTAVTLLRNNPKAMLIPFNDQVRQIRLNVRDTVMTNVILLGQMLGGRTDCAAPLHAINDNKLNVDMVVFLSDNQSWANQSQSGTGMMHEWRQIKQRCPKARMACLDINPNTTSQMAANVPDVMNFGGFSDTVFDILDEFSKGEIDGNLLVKKVEDVVL